MVKNFNVTPSEKNKIIKEKTKLLDMLSLIGENKSDIKINEKILLNILKELEEYRKILLEKYNILDHVRSGIFYSTLIASKQPFDHKSMAVDRINNKAAILLFSNTIYSYCKGKKIKYKLSADKVNYLDKYFSSDKIYIDELINYATVIINECSAL